MISITVKVTDGISPALQALASALDGPEASELCEAGGLSARNAAIAYHRDFDQSGAWRGKHYLGHGNNDGSPFGSGVTAGWSLESFNRDGAVISNDASHYAFKVSGGTITPKRAKFLTIPLIAEARGLKAFEYQERSGKRLFFIKGKRALFERVGGEVTGERGKKRSSAGGTRIKTSQIRAVYALVKSVTMDPWPNAVPPEDVIGDAFIEGYSEGLADIIANL